MSEIPHNNREKWVAAQPVEPLSAASRRAIKANRTKRIKKRLAPFDLLDEQVVSVIERLTPPDGEELGTNTARVILQAQTLRKELLLGRLKAEELERRAETLDVVEEWEKVKRELGIA